jgi:hypothetical protein
MSDQRIRTDEGYLTALGYRLGEERLERFVTGHATVQAMALFLTMAVTTAPQAGYSDDALGVLASDAEDLRAAANEWADSCIALADHWRKQRTAEEARA